MNLSSRRSPMGLKCRHLAGCNTLKQFTDQEQKCGCGGILWSDLRKFSYQEERERQIGTWNVGDICRRDGVARVDSISLFVLSVSRARGAFKCQASVCHVVARGVELHHYFFGSASSTHADPPAPIAPMSRYGFVAKLQYIVSNEILARVDSG